MLFKLKRLWLDAQWISIWHPAPEYKCFVCGRKEQPWHAGHVAVYGLAVVDLMIRDPEGNLQYIGITYDMLEKAVPPENKIESRAYRWYCPALRSSFKTGSLNNHIRYICRRHFGRWLGVRVRDCTTNEYVPFLNRSRWWWLLHDVLGCAKYWIHVLRRFIWLVALAPSGRWLVRRHPRLAPELLRLKFNCECAYDETYGWVIMADCPYHD